MAYEKLNYTNINGRIQHYHYKEYDSLNFLPTFILSLSHFINILLFIFKKYLILMTESLKVNVIHFFRELIHQLIKNYEQV